MRRFFIRFSAGETRLFAASCWGVSTTLLQVALAYFPPDRSLVAASIASGVAVAVVAIGLLVMWISEHYRLQTGFPRVARAASPLLIDKTSLRYRIGEIPDVTRLEHEIQSAYGPGFFSRKAFESRLNRFAGGFHVVEASGLPLGFMSLWPLGQVKFDDYKNGDLSDLGVDEHALQLPSATSAPHGWLCLSYLFRSRDLVVADFLVYHALLAILRISVGNDPIRILMPIDHDQDEGFLRRVGFQRLRDHVSFDNAPLVLYESLRDKSDLKGILNALAARLAEEGIIVKEKVP